eukprot:TRINITY_DN18377_c0_g1_i1.p1 TRINITY_DN18377_c0_g1~~TRINITY_DN18377_c0_g1_i1.p1  ORF type:complete len:183 (-),score=71.59 TRINITY_DN18377_c0_g1_i1:132-611(-)
MSAELVGRACDDYARYVVFPALWSDPSSPHVSQRDGAVEKLLTRLDEFLVFLETVKLESDKSVTLVPQLVEHANKLQEVFATIDKLAATVGRLSQQVGQLEERTNVLAIQAQQQLQQQQQQQQQQQGKSSWWQSLLIPQQPPQPQQPVASPAVVAQKKQ